MKLMCRVLRWICSKFTIKTAERLRLMFPNVPSLSIPMKISENPRSERLDLYEENSTHLTRYFVMSENGQIHFKNLAANPASLKCF